MATEADGDPRERRERDPGDEPLRAPEADAEHEPAERQRPRPARRARALARSANGRDREREQRQRRGADEAEVGERLHVGILDAVPALLGRERERRLRREPPARGGELGLEVRRLGRALPADADERVVEEDAAARCRRAPCDASTSRRRSSSWPRPARTADEARELRRCRASASPARRPATTTARPAASASAAAGSRPARPRRREHGDRAASGDRRARAAAAGEHEPDRAGDGGDPAAAAGVGLGPARARRRRRASAAPESAAKSLWPRNDPCRRRPRPTSKIVDAEELQRRPTALASALQATSATPSTSRSSRGAGRAAADRERERACTRRTSRP